MNITPIPFARDNYLWLIHNDRHAALVDPGDAEAALNALPAMQLEPVAILLTHHHGDHTGGVPGILARFPGIPVFGPLKDNIAVVDHPLKDGDSVFLPELGLRLQALDVAAHTQGHMAYVGNGKLFCGDALFSGGCGRLFEGTPADLENALARLASLDDNTQVYCGHEYTLANLAFARVAEPDNPARDRYALECETLRAEGRPTLPSTIAIERAINPFLRADAASLQTALTAHTGGKLPDTRARLAALRAWKDVY